MRDLLSLVEERRLVLGCTQASVASTCGITQPHYSKVVGRLVRLTPTLEAQLTDWLNSNPAQRVDTKQEPEVLTLTREIARLSRRLATLAARQNRLTARLPVDRATSGQV